MRALSRVFLTAILLGAGAPAIAAPAPAGAVKTGSPTVTDDVRCLMTMTALASNKDRQQAAQIGAYFYMGRITARSPTLNLGAAMKTQAPTLGTQQLPVELRRCGAL